MEQVLGRRKKQTSMQTVANWIIRKSHPFPVQIVSLYGPEIWVVIWRTNGAMCVWLLCVVCVVWAVTVASLSRLIAAYHFLIMTERPIFCNLSDLLSWYINMGILKLFAMCLQSQMCIWKCLLLIVKKCKKTRFWTTFLSNTALTHTKTNKTYTYTINIDSDAKHSPKMKESDRINKKNTLSENSLKRWFNDL